MPSARPNGGSVGGPSGSPVSAANPLIASARLPKPGRAEYGPNWPNAVTRAITSAGLAACSSSGPRPQRSSVPGRKFSMSTSASRDQRQQQPCAVRLAEIDGDGALVAPQRLPPEVDAVFCGTVPARGVRFPRMLDLDHVGAEVAEEGGGEWPGEQGRDVEHAHAVQRPRARSRFVPGEAEADARRSVDPEACQQVLQAERRVPSARRRRTSRSRSIRGRCRP